MAAVNNNNGNQLAALLFWGGEMIKWGELGCVDYSHPPMAMCFLGRRSRRLGDLTAKVEAAMNNSAGGNGENDDGSGVALFGRYPMIFPGEKVVWVAIPLTDDASYCWFLDEAALLSKPLHVYVMPSQNRSTIYDDKKKKMKRKRKKKEQTLMDNSSQGRRKGRGVAMK